MKYRITPPEVGMAGSLSEIVGIGVVVALIYSFGPRLLDYVRIMLLVQYVNMDKIRFWQLFEIGGDEALVFPLSQKLSEKGILLAWKTQRELKAMRVVCEEGGFPFELEAFDNLAASLEAYRAAAGLLSDRVGALAWNSGDEFEGLVPPFVAEKFKAIDHDWAEFRKYSAFLWSFTKRNTNIKTEKS